MEMSLNRRRLGVAGWAGKGEKDGDEKVHGWVGPRGNDRRWPSGRQRMVSFNRSRTKTLTLTGLES